MPEESTFRKYACPKLKLSRKLWDYSSELSLVNYVKVTNRKTFQNKILPEFNSKKQKPFDFYKIAELRKTLVAELCKTLVAELRKTWVSQKQNRAILHEMTFANDCANCCFFRAKLMRKERKILRFVPQKLRKSLRMKTLSLQIFFGVIEIPKKIKNFFFKCKNAKQESCTKKVQFCNRRRKSYFILLTL